MKKYFGVFGLFIVILLYPIVGKIIDKRIGLSGIMQEKEIPEWTIESMWGGDFQNEFDSYAKDNLPGRGMLVKLNSQIMYSLFDASSNQNVVIGKNKVLFEPEYLNYNFNIYGQATEEEIQQLVDDLEKLDELLSNNGKELYVFITPSKARYYGDKAPYYYSYCSNSSNQTLMYDTFVKKLENSSVNAFDSIQYIDGMKEDFEYPLYYSTGIHWSRVLGSHVTVVFNEYLREKSRYDIGQLRIKSVKATKECNAPDADLYEILNLLLPTNETFYYPKLDVIEGKDKPNVFLRGGSFMGQSLSYLISKGIFDKDIHFENNYYFTNGYSTSTTLSSFDAYNELDLIEYIEQSDIVILEVNETKIGTMSWGFIQYVLDNYGSSEEE